MLVERGLRVMSIEVVGEAYNIAENYLRRSGSIPETLITNEPLLETIIQMFHRGDRNKIRLANRAISQFEQNSRTRLQ